MISLIISLIVLLVGYMFYSKLAERIFAPDDRNTPAIAINDGVDYIPMKSNKLFLIQLLNIAGTGPIFGALMGAVFGPVVFLWIVFGSILGGAIHDYLSAMVSSRHEGVGIPELSGIYLGNIYKRVLIIVIIILLILAGTMLATTPAALLAIITPDFLGANFWLAAILGYYILATIFPIDIIIGKIYPIFGIFFVIMALSILGGMLFNCENSIPEITLKNLHPNNLPVWPFMFVTVSCGAISGFHATQSPMVAKCISSEYEGRKVFYGAMISESVIALIWAAAGVAFYGTTGILNDALAVSGQSGVVYEISTGLLGSVGGFLAIVGIIVCPITSGDTSFRSARLILAEAIKLPQKNLKNRLALAFPVIIIAAVLSKLDFVVLWRYIGWTNQLVAMITLWVITSYLLSKGKYKLGSLITAIPASFMSAVAITYILSAPEGFSLSTAISYPVGIVFAIALFILYMTKLAKRLATNI